MRISSPSHALLLALTLLLIGGSALAQNTPAKSSPLSEKENPEFIGKRDINRHQLNFYSIDKEVALGRRISAEVDRASKLVEDPVIVEYINRVGQNLVLHSDAKVPFTIKVIDADEVNAFALPGGFFYVNKGLILAADNEAELAGPMAHEIAHVAARHGTEQDTKGQLVNYGLIPLYIFGGGWTGYAIQQGLGLAIPLGFLKFGRSAEEEADMLAVQYLWASGYDPNAMATFFEKLQGKEKKKPGTIAKIFSTHPVVGDRIDKVKALMVRFPERSEYTVNTSEFNQVKNRLIAQTNARSSISSRSGGTAAERDQQRPTLKRRQPTPPEGATPDAGTSGTTTGGEEQRSERPTLRRQGDTGQTKPPTP
jgi:beta-barrel assembly-enhancing protease